MNLPPRPGHGVVGSMLRSTLFWVHFSLGLLAGLPIAVMSFTGAALAFEKEIIAWLERDARQIPPPDASAKPLPLTELVQHIHAKYPEARVASLAISKDPRAAVSVALPPGGGSLYANPYTGETRAGDAARARAFFRTMMAWHTRLNFTPTPGRPTLGATINSAANAAFVVLALSGLVLWWPRSWRGGALRPILWFVRGARGRAREWNWHNVFGFWSLPVIVVLAGSGVVLSYRWAGDLVYRIAGETPPPPFRPGSPSPKPASGPSPATSIAPEAFFARVQEEIPAWEVITLRFAPPLQRQNAAPVASGGTLTATVRPLDVWPPFAVTTLTLAAATGEKRKVEEFSDQTVGQRARRWIRLLHTGEALRWPGQLAAGLGCLAGCFLAWTGIAMAWRRMFRRGERPSPESASSPAPTP